MGKENTKLKRGANAPFVWVNLNITKKTQQLLFAVPSTEV